MIHLYKSYDPNFEAEKLHLFQSLTTNGLTGDRLESFKRGIPKESNVWPMTDPWDERNIYRHLWLIFMEN